MNTHQLTATSPRRPADPGALLGRHLKQCAAARGRWFGAAQLAEQVHGLVAPRIVTTVGLAAALLTLACTGL